MVVVGAGRSGRAAAALCLARGAHVTLSDARTAAAVQPALGELATRCTLELGAHRAETLRSADLVVVSPGVPPLPQLEAAEAAGVPLIGELELAYRCVRAPIIGITGTNGKSTTTKLVGEILRVTGRPVFWGGNFGQPLSEVVDQPVAGPEGLLVLELSSFQLERIEQFSAHIAVLLNLSEDHLDRYPSYLAYQRAKARLFERQRPEDFALLSDEPDQPEVRALAAAGRAQRLGFALAPGAERAAWQAEGALCLRLPGGEVERYPRRALRLPGRHNTLNALAALLTARLAGASVAACEQGLRQFVGLPHRMELVGERASVRFYDDSKATNVGAVAGSLAGFEQPVVLLAGGKDKGGDYAPLRAVVEEVCRHVVLIGAAADRIASALAGTVPLHRAPTLEQAVADAAALAQPGDAVVLSPACSSYDMFRDFEHRGRVFRAAVAAL
ncbi:MAG: UDP-N-acetylmuramoyl-L-alanine--D-glutamate ligase [Proteobacteria bacterium]|nr:UDP-N-acetylmuramoyl-L-alanine--D-glutamate ligase [Pseudomonadota bacterium]